MPSQYSKANLIFVVMLILHLSFLGVLLSFLDWNVSLVKFLIIILIFACQTVILLIHKRTLESAERLQIAIEKLNKETRFGAFENFPSTHRHFDILDHLMFSIKDLFEGKYLPLILDKQIELQHLQNQINPHFIYNTLEGIRAKALLEDQPDIASMTETLALFLRYNIGKVDEMVSLGRELQNLERYITIQKFRFGNKIDLSIQIDSPELYRKVMLPKLTLQPIVENAVYHGLEPKKEGGMITISAIVSDQNIRICIADNGIGMDEQALFELNESLLSSEKIQMKKSVGKSTGIALDNINERIKIFYGSSYGLFVHSTEGVGTDVYIKIPLPPDLEI